MVAEKSSLKHIEERLDRFVISHNEMHAAEHEEVLALIAANDLRYQQRFEAQGKALDAAFGAAKGAVDAALAGADKAAVKTELSADKRFADLGDLIREQFKGMNNKLESLAARVTSAEDRLNTSYGENLGKKNIKEQGLAIWALVISVLIAAIAFITLAFKMIKQ